MKTLRNTSPIVLMAAPLILLMLISMAGSFMHGADVVAAGTAKTLNMGAAAGAPKVWLADMVMAIIK